MGLLAALMVSNVPYPAVPIDRLAVAQADRRRASCLSSRSYCSFFRPRQFFFPALLAYVLYGALKWIVLGLIGSRSRARGDLLPAGAGRGACRGGPFTVACDAHRLLARLKPRPVRRTAMASRRCAGVVGDADVEILGAASAPNAGDAGDAIDTRRAPESPDTEPCRRAPRRLKRSDRLAKAVHR